MTRRPLGILLVAFVILATACGGSSSGRAPTAPTTAAPPPPAASPGAVASAFVVSGDPSASGGATWTYRSTDVGVAYDLAGVLYRPAGAGPFGAVILSHGLGDQATRYARDLAPQFVSWGLVVIATNYTHAGGVPVGSPGTLAEPGASEANVQRAAKLIDLLALLGYVDLQRVAAHGHSAGGFVTAAFAGTHSSRLRAASHTAAGVGVSGITTATLATSEAQASGVRVPYQQHHGDRDFVVPLVLAQRLDAILAANGVPRELHVYPGEGHDIATHPQVLGRIREWYGRHGVLR